MDNFWLYSGDELQIRFENGTHVVVAVWHCDDEVELLYHGSYEKCVNFCKQTVAEDLESIF